MWASQKVREVWLRNVLGLTCSGKICFYGDYVVTVYCWLWVNPPLSNELGQGNIRRVSEDRVEEKLLSLVPGL